MAGDHQPAGWQLADRLWYHFVFWAVIVCHPPGRLTLRREDLAAADAGEAQQAQQFFLVIGRAFRRGLDLGDLAVFDQHEVGVGIGGAVLDP
jgi:hypothetical protein